MCVSPSLIQPVGTSLEEHGRVRPMTALRLQSPRVEAESPLMRYSVTIFTRILRLLGLSVGGRVSIDEVVSLDDYECLGGAEECSATLYLCVFVNV